MALATARPADQPMMELNTTPLIDVLLVLLILFVITIPAATHSLPVDLPSGAVERAVDPVVNRVTLTGQGAILWNGDAVSQPQLAALLRRSAIMAPEPELQFAPEAQAPYDLAAHVTGTIKASGVSRFGFVGNDRYAEFGKPNR